MSALALGGLLVWGVITGIDLVSVLQVMVARPLVAASVAGWIAGDPVAGVLTGMVLELYALEVLPVGGARYPDYGPAAVAASAAAAGGGVAGLAFGVTVALLVAYAGEWSVVILRRRNTRYVRRHAAALDGGAPADVQRAQLGGILWDAVRALLLTVLGLGLAWAVRRWPPIDPRAAAILLAVLVGVGVATAALNGRRLVAGWGGAAWLGAGLAGGIAWILLR